MTASTPPPAVDHDVCVIGLGPTGLVMSHLLAAHGLRVLALEREPRFYGLARAVYTDGECLRILQRAGVADEVLADMLVDRPVRWVSGAGSVLAVAHDRRRPQGWPASNFLYQPLFESTLESRLADRAGVTVLRGRAVTAVRDDDDDDVVVVVTHSASSGSGYGNADAPLVPGTEERVTARFVVACDGGRSPVREQLGIGMEGHKFPERWLVVDLSTRPGLGHDPFAGVPHFDFVCDPALPTVSCPQPGGRHRLEFLLTDADDPDEFASDPSLRQMLSRWVDPDDVVVDRRLVYTFNALIASRWRHGRILLAGDAAHMMPQFVGQGMNSGLRDADNLAWKLAEVVVHGADTSLLDTYESERAAHVRGMTRLSVTSKNVVSWTHPALTRLRDRVLPTLAHAPGTRRMLRETWMKPRARFRRGSYYGQQRRLRPGRAWLGLHGPEGTLFPQARVVVEGEVGAEGTPVSPVAAGRLDDVVGRGWAMVGVGVDPDSVAPPAHLRGRLPALVRVAPDSEGLRWSGVRAGDVVVLRPDGYVHSVLRP